MIATCHPISQAVAHDMLQGIIFSICDRPGDTPEQRDARSRSVVHAVLAFEPRDPVEMMLAGMAVGHSHLLLDWIHDAFRKEPDAQKVRSIVALDRVMTGFLKELRFAQARPMEGEAVEPRGDPATEPTAKRAPKLEAGAQPASEPSVARAGSLSPAPARSPATAAGAPIPPFGHGEASDAALTAILSSPVKSRVIDAGRRRSGPLESRY
jgi:hypothetical protein